MTDAIGSGFAAGTVIENPDDVVSTVNDDEGLLSSRADLTVPPKAGTGR